MSPIKSFTVTSPVRDLLMHANIRTDMKEIGFNFHHDKAHKELI